MKIMLVGFYGEDNLGDNAILEAILNHIDKETNIKITSGKMFKTAQTIKRRGILSWPAYIKNIINSDKAIFSGGILQDWTSEGVTFFALRIIAASFLGCKPSLWGTGIGPLRSNSMKSLVKKTLRHIDKAWVRDAYSAKLYNELSLTKCNLGTDWSWFYKIPEHKKANNEYELINIRPWLYNMPIIENLKNKQNEHKYIGIAARREDESALKSFFKQETNIIKPDSYEELLELCSNFNYGTAMRYHIALAMLRSGINTTLIPYDEKVNELNKQKANLVNFIKDNELLFTKMSNEFKNYLSK